MYKIIRSFLFLFEAEKAHHISMGLLKKINNSTIFKGLIKRLFSPASDSKIVSGLQFRNIVGLGAGFDKNALYLSELDEIGFGFVEIGTVTPLPQEGNDLPRLFRLKEDYALINRMGFNNSGMDVVNLNIKTWREKNPSSNMIVGGNIGKNKNTPNEDAWQDYLKCFSKLYNEVDYFVVNVSSPNTPGLRELQEKDSLHLILTSLQNERKSFNKQKPIYLKISPDLSREQVDIIIELALEIKLDGLIIANTTISRENLKTSEFTLKEIGNGGLSGKPLTNISDSLLSYIYGKTGKRLSLISSGGIFKKEDLDSRINNGADLIQIWTGFIYEGPYILKKLLTGKSKSK